MVPQIYDITIDDFRDITPSDVHMLETTREAFGEMRRAAVEADMNLVNERDLGKRAKIAEDAISRIHFASSMAIDTARTPPDILAARAKVETKESA